VQSKSGFFLYTLKMASSHKQLFSFDFNVLQLGEVADFEALTFNLALNFF
jgi:hypothetical protein